MLTPSSFTMSSLNTASPFAQSSSTFIHAQLALLALPVTPQQKSFKSAHSILRKPISPTLHTSHSDFFTQMLILLPMTPSCISLPLPTLSYSPGRPSVDPPEIPRNCFPSQLPPTLSAITQQTPKAQQPGITLFPMILLLH